MSRLEVKGFGGLELSANSFTIQHFPERHVEELLGYLLLNQNKSCSRESLIELLWPYQVIENGRGSLNTVLWRLRRLFKQLGFGAQSFLISSRDQIIFAPKYPLQFDVHSFEKHLDEASVKEDDVTKIGELTKALALYQGDLYTGIYSDWCLVERERLAQRHLQALGQLLQCQIRRNEFEMAIETGQHILSIDPLREEVHRDLIFIYGRLHRRSEAAAQFQLCVDRLMLELKVFPMPETVEVYQQVLSTSAGNSLPRSNRALLERANRANVAFQQAGSKLLKILTEIENKSNGAVS